MEELVMSNREILDACERIGADLTNRLKGVSGIPLFVCVMKGAINFMVDLMQNVEMDILTDYIQIRSFEGMESTGKVTLIKDASHRVKDRTVVIVEDVVDTGISMDFLTKHFQELGAKEVIVVALFDKKDARKVPVKIDYVGKVLEGSKFLVGYGLDYRGLMRNVPFVYVPTKDEVAEWDALLEKR